MNVIFQKGHKIGFVRSSFLRCFSATPKFYFCAKMSKFVDAAVPNEGWSKESVELFNKLNSLLCAGEGWKKLTSRNLGDSRIFARAIPDPGKFMEYAFFCNKESKISKGVAQFGAYTVGWPGYVHGGALFTIFDAIMGTCCLHCGYKALTANLTVNFKRHVPLDSTVLLEARIDKVEGRKIYISGAMKTLCGTDTYAEATSLFVSIELV